MKGRQEVQMRAWLPVIVLSVGCDTLKFDPILDTDTDVEDTDPFVFDTIPDTVDTTDSVDTVDTDPTDTPEDSVDPVDTPADTTDTTPPATGPNDVRIGDLLITEVMFDPAACAQTDCEYVEIAWLGAAPIDLGGLELHDSTSTTTLPSPTVVQPGGRLLFAHSATAQSYGAASDITLVALLANGGEDVWLEDPNGRELDRLDGNLFSVLDGTAWERDDVDPDVWCYADLAIAGTGDLGSPRAPNGLCSAPIDTDTVDTDTVDTDPVDTVETVPATGVDAITVGDLLITEIMFDPGDCRESEGEYVEITWYGADPVDLGGLGVHDSTAVTTLPTPTVVQPGERVIVGRAPMDVCYGAPAQVTTTLSLSNSGEDIWLTDRTGRELDRVDGNELAVAPGRAWERDDLDLTLWCFGDTDIGPTLDRGSPGQPNGTCAPIVDTGDTDVGPAPGLGEGDVLITEFMANPDQCADDVAEYFEILNPGSAPIDLSDVEVSDDGNAWLIPSGTTIQPGETIALLRDPGARPGCYGITGLLYAAVIGLGQNGDHLRLTAPSGNLVDEVDFATWTITAGVAWERDPIDPAVWCLADAPIPGQTDLGSPGVANDACPP